MARRLFVVPLAGNNHGKTTLIKALVTQGEARFQQNMVKGKRLLVSPRGREIDAYAFGRSYQEIEKWNSAGKIVSVIDALDNNDAQWRDRELIIFPSHVDANDAQQMIDAAHAGGFDAICATVIITGNQAEDPKQFSDVWKLNWDERWTIPNPRLDSKDSDLKTQLQALGHDLWTWISQALTL